MFFRNLTMFRISSAAFLDQPSYTGNIDAALQECRLKPVGPQEMSSRGFVPPIPGADEDEQAMLHRVGDGIWLTLGVEDKILPASVVDREVAKRAAELEEQEGRKLGGRARKRLKDDVLHDLLPRAFVKSSRVNVHIDTVLGVVFVDTASRKVAEGVISELRRALGSFPATPLNPEASTRAVLTDWLDGGEMPRLVGINPALGAECELKEPGEGGAIARCSQQEMLSDEIAKHLEVGKLCSKLGLAIGDYMSFVLGDDLVVRKLKFLDGAIDKLDLECESIAQELDARYALMVGELKVLFRLLDAAFKISPYSC